MILNHQNFLGNQSRNAARESAGLCRPSLRLRVASADLLWLLGLGRERGRGEESLLGFGCGASDS